LAGGGKCQRCWRILPEVGGGQDAPETCGRCGDVMAKQRQAAE
jgi:isoleucyl-tRNA synthetase